MNSRQNFMMASKQTQCCFVFGQECRHDIFWRTVVALKVSAAFSRLNFRLASRPSPCTAGALAWLEIEGPAPPVCELQVADAAVTHLLLGYVKHFIDLQSQRTANLRQASPKASAGKSKRNAADTDAVLVSKLADLEEARHQGAPQAMLLPIFPVNGEERLPIELQTFRISQKTSKGTSVH